jgi:medium-chain acyl-[acyl-carrier-protein] hydrolase
MSKDRHDIWFPYVKRNPAARIRLFCFPYAGGSALIFRNWINFFDSQVEVYPVQFPGRGQRIRETPFTGMGTLLDALRDAIFGYLDKPFIFFGHSMGATISFELAHKLSRERGRDVAHLIVSGRKAPQIPDRHPLTFDLPEPEFVKELRRLKGTPPEALKNQELLTLLLPLIRSDFELIQTYRYMPKSPLSCGITAMGGADDDDVSCEDIQAWQEQAGGSFSLRMFSGDHFYLHSMEKTLLEAVALIIEKIKDEI